MFLGIPRRTGWPRSRESPQMPVAPGSRRWPLLKFFPILDLTYKDKLLLHAVDGPVCRGSARNWISMVTKGTRSGGEPEGDDYYC